MTGNEILTLGKARIKDSSITNFDWNSWFAIIIDEIFSAKDWRFARQEMNYIHPQSTYEFTFDDSAQQLALNKLVGAYFTTSFTLVGGIPVPVTNTAAPLEYWPYADFILEYPDHQIDGVPVFISELVANDGTNGMQIGIYPRPNADAAVWIYGDFKPSYNIDNNPLPILPLQFHRLVLYGLIREAADDKGKDSTYAKASRKFDAGMVELDDWDRRQPIYRPRFQKAIFAAPRKRPFYPPNFDRSVSR